MKKIVIDATIDNLGLVKKFICDELLESDCLSSINKDIIVAAEEIFVNIASYAYAHIGCVSVEVKVDDVATIRFSDGGMPFDPLEKEDPNFSLEIEDRCAGGNGIYMVKKLMDEVDYVYEDEKNILTIKRLLRC